jgi:CRP-like cAMP-binding protein
MCKFLQFKAHKRGQLIYKEGQDSIYVYFILSGQVKISKHNATHLDVKVIMSGSSFGRPETLKKIDTRSKHSASCLSSCELLYLETEIFRNIMLDQSIPSEIGETLNSLSRLDLLKNQSPELLEQIAANSRIRYFATGDTIVVIPFYKARNSSKQIIIFYSIGRRSSGQERFIYKKRKR